MDKLLPFIADQIRSAEQEPTNIVIQRYTIEGTVWKVTVQIQPTGTVDIRIKNRGTA